MLSIWTFKLTENWRRRVNRGLQIRRSVMIYQPNPPLNFRPESEIRAKIFVLHAKSKIRAQKIDESAFRCSYRIRKPLKSRFESEIRTKIFSKSADPFAYSPPLLEQVKKRSRLNKQKPALQASPNLVFIFMH